MYRAALWHPRNWSVRWGRGRSSLEPGAGGSGGPRKKPGWVSPAMISSSSCPPSSFSWLLPLSSLDFLFSLYFPLFCPFFAFPSSYYSSFLQLVSSFPSFSLAMGAGSLRLLPLRGLLTRWVLGWRLGTLPLKPSLSDRLFCPSGALSTCLLLGIWQFGRCGKSLRRCDKPPRKTLNSEHSGRLRGAEHHARVAACPC